MAYLNRYLAQPEAEVADHEAADPESWVVVDTEGGQVMLGAYGERGARNMARRLNADISLSPNEMRALNTLCSVGRLTRHQLYEQFKGKVQPFDGADKARVLVDKLVGHGLATVEGDGASITDWGRTWLGRS